MPHDENEKRGLADADQETRERVAREGGKASHEGGRPSEEGESESSESEEEM